MNIRKQGYQRSTHMQEIKEQAKGEIIDEKEAKAEDTEVKDETAAQDKDTEPQ